MNFKKLKQDFLLKKDKSKKGNIDKPIIKLINKLNASENYFTTSSCSGRIVLLEKKSEKKNEAQWIFKKHYAVNFFEIKKTLKNTSKYGIWLRFEPAIFHIACRTIEDAQKIIDIARAVGFKRSGIQAIRKKILVEICSSDIIDTIISKNGKLIVTDSYLEELVQEANKKMDINKAKIGRLYNLLLKSL